MNFFAPLVGQNQAVELLTQAVAQNRVAPAYLFTGPEGVGRSIAARCFVELLFCTHLAKLNSNTPADEANIKHGLALQKRLAAGNHPDLLWVQPTYLHQGERLSAAQAAEKGVKRKAPPQIRLEQIREIGQFLGRYPLEAPRNVIVLEAAETMAEAAANGLLKTLEEPGQATLILMAPSESVVVTDAGIALSADSFLRFRSGGDEASAAANGSRRDFEASTSVSDRARQSGECDRILHATRHHSPDLLQDITQLPKSDRNALQLAKKIDKTLDTEAQLWLVDYLQHSYWQQFLDRKISKLPLQHLEKAREYLQGYAQPRLVWEVTLLNMI
jgi:DNA polymerase-3 subunit delta'